MSADARLILRLNDRRQRLPTLGFTMSLIVESSVTAKLNSSTVKSKGACRLKQLRSFFTLLRLQMAHLVAIADLSITRKKIAEHVGTLSDTYLTPSYNYARVTKRKEHQAKEHTCIKDMIPERGKKGANSQRKYWYP